MLRWINRVWLIPMLFIGCSALASELQTETLVVGDGIAATTSKRVTVHYEGRLLDGTVFDASKPRGAPFSFTIGAGKVIKGWEQGLVGMKVGEVRRLTIPSDLAYGATGVGDVIPPNSDLIFEIELLAVEDAIMLKELTPDDLLKAKAEGTLIVDIRREDEWIETGIIEGSRTITAFQADGRLHPDFQRDFMPLVASKDTPLILYCRSGTRTGSLGNALIEQIGLTNVSHLTGGMMQWQANGHPTVDFAR